ncbi:hypothetical protein BG015_008785 [Linnemannia schmuckeri]|uniref:NAD(P)-binding protein n=1 Tax=Linnemannia schmuckeri TaxID=64567 RepID=A0A9P5RYZ6_9FUNG|nr:hypothetical protein BG015_008785 [Linnemannia schmuckeri]
MGQVNSTEAHPSSRPINVDPVPAPTPQSSSPSIPSIEDMRNLTSRILASTNDALKNLRENIPAIELPASLSSSSSSSSSSSDSSSTTSAVSLGSDATHEAGMAAASMTDGLGLASDSNPVMVLTSSNDQPSILVYRSFGNSDRDNSASVTELIKLHYYLSIEWVKENPMQVAMGAVALGAALVVGTMAINSIQAHRQKQRRLRVLRGKGDAKREVVVVTNVSTLEGASLALSLDQEGFVVFVGVSNQARADEVEQWGRTDIRPVIVDATKANPFEELVKTVSSFLDQNNSALLGGSPLSLSSSVIYQEELSSSTANIRLINPEHTLKSVIEAESKRRHHGKTDTPLFRLAAVIINQHSSPVGSIEKVELDLWRQAIDANITGTVIAAQKFMPLMRRTLALAKPRRSPRLIFVSSAITGSIGFPFQSAICASHHAVESIADSLRREVKSQGIDVVCLRPGIADRSFRKEWGEKSSKANVGGLGLLNTMDPTKILKATFKSESTTAALCDAIYDAITKNKPAACVRVGNGSLSYSFVGWAVPRSIVDWAVQGKSVKIYSPATVKVSNSSTKVHEE